MNDRRRVLVAGGAGFIGSNLCRALLDEGSAVDCVDNLITGDIKSVRALRASPRFRFFKLDITDPAFVAMALTGRYDHIYHLACPTGVPNIETYGEEMVQTCSLGTENLLRIASSQNATLVYASSAEVYGDPQQFPQSESYCGHVDPVGPRSAYEEGKRFGEALTRLYARKYEVDAKIVRIFNTYGVGMRLEDTRVIPSFLRCLKGNRRLTIYGDGRQTRTHLYIDDLLDGLRKVAASGEPGEVYNIGGDKQLSILELVGVIRSLTPLPVKTTHVPHFISDHGGRQPMIEKVTALGWRPVTSLHEGLRRMFERHELPLRERCDEHRPAIWDEPPIDHVAGLET